MRENVERIVREVVEEHSSTIGEVVRKRLLEELAAQPGEAPGTSPTDLLNAAVASVQDATAQTDILKALLDGATKFSERAGLLVVRGTTATGWQGRGFDDNDSFKLFTADCTKGLCERVLQNRTPAAAAADEFDTNFVHRFGHPEGNVVLLPLVIKEKVAAMIYADGGKKGSAGLDGSALELLVRCTGLWLEILSFRKLSPGEHHAAHEIAPAPAHAPVAKAASAPAVAAAAPVPQSAAGAIPVPPPPPPSNGASAEDEVRNKAKRFAKLLVEEIKLYNQSKVSEGRSTRDLYDRLKDDIDKSRATYDKRYGQTVKDVDYFTQELVRILADNDRSVLGANFRW
jgi:hypothetical protein